MPGTPRPIRERTARFVPTARHTHLHRLPDRQASVHRLGNCLQSFRPGRHDGDTRNAGVQALLCFGQLVARCGRGGNLDGERQPGLREGQVRHGQWFRSQLDTGFDRKTQLGCFFPNPLAKCGVVIDSALRITSLSFSRRFRRRRFLHGYCVRRCRGCSFDWIRAPNFGRRRTRRGFRTIRNWRWPPRRNGASVLFSLRNRRRRCHRRSEPTRGHPWSRG